MLAVLRLFSCDCLQFHASPSFTDLVFLIQERLTSHGGGIGLTAGTPAYSGHTTGSGGRSSSLSSSQHGHGPSTHQSADFQPPYFPPPFHHTSTHQSSAASHQQQQARETYGLRYLLLLTFHSRIIMVLTT